MEIRNIIAELLSLHDCVIIPGFGGFIGNYSPARIDPVNHTFYPPYKQLLFNVNLKQNDGLLAHEVSTSYNISYPEACRIIDDFSEECRFTINSGKSCMLPRIGLLYPGTEGIIHFEQDLNANLLPEAFGLLPFVSPPVIRHSRSLRLELNQAVPATGQPGRRHLLPRALKWAAVIVLPIGLATVIGVTQYDKISASMQNNAGILSSVFTRFSAASLVEKKAAPLLPARTIVLQVKPPVPVLQKETVISQDDRFAVIVGAFKVQENAEKLIAELKQKGVSASIFDQSRTGLFRVTIGTCSNRDDIKALLATAKSSDISGAWILAK